MAAGDLHRLGAAYVLDALDPDERAAFEAHLPGCPDCRGELTGFREAAASLTQLTAAAPPPDLRDRVLADVARTRQLSPRPAPRPRRLPGPALLAAAAALVLVVVAGAALLLGRGEDFGDRLADVLDAPDARTAVLQGDGPGELTVVWSAERDEVVVVGSRLDPAAAGRAYELWLLGDEGPVPVELLDAAAGGTIRRVVDLPGEPGGWGVTLEPSSGSPTPTGDVLYAADI